MSPWVVGTVIVIVVGLLVFLAVVMRFFGLWIQCKTTGAGIGLIELVLMRLR